jgi:hypothetical protein
MDADTDTDPYVRGWHDCAETIARLCELAAMPSQHKHQPIPFRPPEGDRLWLAAYAEQVGRPVNAILTEALVGYRRSVEAHADPVIERWHNHPSLEICGPSCPAFAFDRDGYLTRPTWPSRPAG